jgi:hypothetical protein
MTSSIQVSEEISRLLGNDPICGGRVTNDTVQAIAALVRSKPIDRDIERLGEALFNLSDKMRASGILSASDAVHEAYERVVAEFTAIGSQSIEGEMSPNGDAGDAIDFALGHIARPDDMRDFLEDWRDGRFIEDWQSYMEWLQVQRDGASLAKDEERHA